MVLCVAIPGLIFDGVTGWGDLSSDYTPVDPDRFSASFNALGYMESVVMLLAL